MTKKYELTKTKYQHFEFPLFQIRALRDFGDVKAGDLGGYIQSEDNLSQYGTCWIYPDAKVYIAAKVLDHARVRKGWVWNRAILREHALCDGLCFVYCDCEVFGNSKILGEAHCDEDSKIFENAIIKDRGCVRGRAWVHGNAQVGGFGSAGGDAELTGTFKLNGNGRVFTGYNDKGVVESWSPYTIDVTLHG